MGSELYGEEDDDEANVGKSIGEDDGISQYFEHESVDSDRDDGGDGDREENYGGNNQYHHHEDVLALPYGCGGALSVVNVTKGGFDGLIWTCSGIDPGYRSLYESGQNTLWSTTEQTSATNCANYCSGWYKNGLNAGVYYPNSTCQCWTYGDINTSPSAATATSGNATFLDFYETGNLYGPPAAVDWGVFTCPAGAYRNFVGERGSFYGACYPLTIDPGQKALADCPSTGEHWEIWTKVNGFNVITCYATLGLAKVSVNFSSPYTLVDIYDFTTRTSTLSTKTSTKSPSTTTKYNNKQKQDYGDNHKEVDYHNINVEEYKYFQEN
ncbi:hypothetical protein F4803DRAFT_573637 [Xylaria telfairii]|nr:hypothetical protein F4803DRAFT_573637 [Xylaria telfairii]